jgi:hypothetical protein
MDNMELILTNLFNNEIWAFEKASSKVMKQNSISSGL